VCTGNPLPNLYSLPFGSKDLQNDEQVFTIVEERATKARYRIRSRHVIGCDGAKSEVRKSLGIECEGEDSCKFSVETTTTHF
jgi:2-polyprenyl-6-methoxyphenol hydroxylase-like FAD-dependent oxidoreductase